VVLALLVLLVLLAGAATAVVLVGRSKLDDSSSQVDDAWAPLRAPLAVRYLRLAAVANAFREAGAGDRTVTRDLDRLLDEWGEERNAEDPDPEAEVAIANALEGAARRVLAANQVGPRLQANEPLQTAIAEFTGSTVPEPAVAAYERATRDYQDTVDATLWSPAARIFGYDTRPVLTLAS
jgi:hypothetical protein